MKTARIPFARFGGATLATLVALVALAAWPVQAAEDVYYYKITASLPVIRINTSGAKPKLETKILNDKDLINIALGRKLGTNVGTRVLAARSPDRLEEPGKPVPRLFIYDLSTRTIVLELGTVSSFQYDRFRPKVTGTVTGFGVLTLGDTGTSTTAKLYPATLNAASKATGTADPFNFNPKLAGTTTTLSGRLAFDFTDARGTFAHFEGIVISGKLGLTGKAFAIVPE